MSFITGPLFDSSVAKGSEKWDSRIFWETPSVKRIATSLEKFLWKKEKVKHCQGMIMGKSREAEERSQWNRVGTCLWLFHVQTYDVRPRNIPVPGITMVRMSLGCSQYQFLFYRHMTRLHLPTLESWACTCDLLWPKISEWELQVSHPGDTFKSRCTFLLPQQGDGCSITLGPGLRTM